VKNFLAPVIFILFSFNLHAQEYREARVFILPITGIGTAEANAYFYKQLTYETAAQFCAVVKLKSNSDYTLKGKIEPFACNHDSSVVCPYHLMIEKEAISNQNPEYVFYLELIDSSTDEIAGWQYIVFSRIDRAVESMVSVMVYNMLTTIPDIELEDDRRHSWIFISAGAMWAPRIYTNEIDSVYWLNAGASVAIEIQFLKYLSIGAGAQFSQDWILISREEEIEYRDLIIEIPLAIKLVLKPAGYLLEPYGGLSYNISLMNTTVPSQTSWFAGIQLGVRTGPGFLTVDTRFSMDFFNSNLSPSLETQLEYRRFMIQLAIGYKFGLISKYKNKS